jgi:hypothetical protein
MKIPRLARKEANKMIDIKKYIKDFIGADRKNGSNPVD